MSMINVITAACALAVLVRVICIASHLNVHMWPGQKIRFTAFATALSGMGAAAFGVAACLPMAEHALLASIAGVLVFDRRRPREREREHNDEHRH